MSIEGGGDSPKDKVLELVKENFARGDKLDRHAFNIVLAVEYVFSDNGPEDPQDYLSHYHYEEYLRSTYNQNQADTVMQLSDPEAVAAFDSIIDELIQNIETIESEAVEEYCTRLRKLIKGK